MWNLNKQGHTESGDLRGEKSHVTSLVGPVHEFEYGGSACWPALTTLISDCSAGLLLVIYFFFYASLAAVITLCMYTLFLTISPYVPTFTERVKPPGECPNTLCCQSLLDRNLLAQHVQPQLTVALPGNNLGIQLLRVKVKWYLANYGPFHFDGLGGNGFMGINTKKIIPRMG